MILVHTQNSSVSCLATVELPNFEEFDSWKLVYIKGTPRVCISVETKLWNALHIPRLLLQFRGFIP